VNARALLAAALAFSLTVAPATASLQDDLDEIGSDIRDLQAQIDAAQSVETDLAGQISATTARMESLVADLAEAEADLVAVADRIAEREVYLLAIREDLEAHYRALDDTRRTAAATRERAEAQVVSLYMSGGTETADLIFSVTDMLEASLSLEYAARASEHTDEIGRQLEALELEQERQAEAVAETEAEVEAEVEQLRVFRAQLQDLADQVAERKARVEAELDIQRTLLSTVRTEIDHFESELDALEREQERVETLIRQAQDTSGDAPGILLRPVGGRITSSYGPRVHPILGTTRLHTGVDFGAAYGTPISAAASGKVIHSGGFGGYGNTVIIDHGGGMSTLYAHQSEVRVSLGDQVESGATIGLVGSTGLSTGPHLHFEVRILGSPVDPAPYL
jgi:murein DD-endopeptidase MepM/ murein hydrolase activator NlpD